MASELKRVAQGLVDTLNEVPGVVAHLHRTAAGCRENAALVMHLAGSRGAMAAQQLDAAARACDAAAHCLSMAPPKALGWAQGLVAVTPDASDLPDSGRADRNLAAPGRLSDGPCAGHEREPAGKQPEPVEAGPFIEGIFRRLPRRKDDKAPTSGILSTPDGRALKHLISGSRGPGAGSPGLTGDVAKLSVAQDHVEGHAAALLRRAGAPREMTLYLNNKPCAGDGGCDATLEDQLPKGTKLTVYWPGDHKVYRGNGKGMG